MKLALESLKLVCKQSTEQVDLSSHITIFHGKMGAGKSSIARLIDFCFGGNSVQTVALKKELLSVALVLKIEENEVLIEREKNSNNDIQVSWTDLEGDSYSVQAPLRAEKTSIFKEEEIFNFSDLILYLFNLQSLKVRRSKEDESSPLIRLSIRDIFWYCYLDQDSLDSSFFNLEFPFKAQKSKDVMKFVVGYYSQKLNSLEIELEKSTLQRDANQRSIEELIKFLSDFGYSSANAIQQEIQSLNEQINETQSELDRLQQGYSEETHAGDELRNQIIKLDLQISEKEEVKRDLEDRISQQSKLRSEIISSKFKLARSLSAKNIFSGVEFSNCPQCDNENVGKNRFGNDKCSLCGNDLEDPSKQSLDSQPESIRIDLDNRLLELEKSIYLHEEGFKKAKRELRVLTERKKDLDKDFYRKVKVYESAYMSKYRVFDRKLATLKERLSNRQSFIRFPKEVQRLQVETDTLNGRIERYREEIRNEKQTFVNADKYLGEIEKKFIQFLLDSKVPGVTEKDIAHIDRKTWKVSIFPEGAESMAYGFATAGSGGKKTLFKVCYALAIHTVAATKNLPIPSLLIIDTPMKNIGEDVNRDTFVSFYTLLYKLAEKELSNIQIIVIDKEFFPPEETDLEIRSRFMSPDENPLISYYHGA